MGSKREVKLIVSALLLLSTSAFAQLAYQPPGPPFYVYDVPTDMNGLITKPSCMSADGNIPAFASIPGGNIAAVAMFAQSNATNAGFAKPCSVGSSFNSSGSSVAPTVSFIDAGNTMTISTNDTTVPSYSPAFGPNWTGASLAQYEQQFYAPPGTQIALSYTINGNGFVYIAVVSPCPDPPGSCVVGSTGGTPSYGGLTASLGVAPTPTGPPTANNAIFNLPPFFVSSSGMYVVGIEVFTGNQYPFPYYQSPNTLSVTSGCGVGARLTGNGSTVIQGQAFPIFSNSTLSQAAAACKYVGFDWMQWVTNAPCPSPIYPAVPSLVPNNLCSAATPTPGGLFTPPALNDPPNGGYTYETQVNTGQAYNPYPFYYPAQVAITPNADLPLLSSFGDVQAGAVQPININDRQLDFFDSPGDGCLPTGPLTDDQAAKLLVARAEICGGPTSTDPLGSYLGFATALVGVNADGSAGQPFFYWTWTDTFNGYAGGINVPVVSQAPNPNSGAGSITLTGINGVPVPRIIPPTQVSITASGLAYSRVSKTFNGTVTITNISGITLTTPSSFQLVLNSLPSGVTLVDSMGTFNECPYITIPALLNMAPGQSVTVAVQFSNPSNATINFTPEFYAGSFQ